MLKLSQLEGRSREACPTCGWIHYEQLKATAGLLIEHNENVLLVKRAQEPWKGAWYLPAGYLEADERPEQGALREVGEETGIEADISELFGVYYYNDDPRGNGLLILYKATPKNMHFQLSAESEACAYFSAKDAIAMPLAGMAHQMAINDWAASKND